MRGGTAGTVRHHPAAHVGRALLVYLVLAWLLLGLLPDGRSSLAASGVIAGFPLVVVVSLLLARRAPRRLGRGWRQAGAAGLTAVALPLLCLLVPGAGGRPQDAVAASVERIAARLADGADEGLAADRLRLRIEGLTLAASTRAPGDGAAGQAAELLLDTCLRARDGRRELEITVSLRGARDGGIRWRAVYVADPDDPDEIHATIRRALAEAMRRTRQGTLPGELV